MSSKFNDILYELKKPTADKLYQKEWLISVTASSGNVAGASLTSGVYSQFKEYTNLKNYCEDIDLVSGQDSGIKGVCISNVKILILRNGSSVQMLKAFRSNYLFNSINLLQVMRSGEKYITINSIEFKNCKITNAKIFLDEIEFYFKYGQRNEKYSLMDESGVNKGFI